MKYEINIKIKALKIIKNINDFLVILPSMLGRFLVRGLFLSNLISTYRLNAIAKFLALINAMELKNNTSNPNHPLAATTIAININEDEKIVC